MELLLQQVLVFYILISISFYEVHPACTKVELQHGKATMLTHPYYTMKYKCDDGFQMFGASMSICLGKIWNPPVPVCHAKGCDQTGYISLPNGKIDIISQNSMLIVQCNPGYIMDGERVISCDGQHWSEPIPHCYPAVDINQCDFEHNSLCGWTMDKNHQSDWISRSGETDTKRTGPLHDHTLGLGHYLYMESSIPNRIGHKSRLLSPVYPWYKSRRCFQLWYHMLGPMESGYMGDLEILLRQISGQNVTERQLFAVSGNQGDEWHRAEVFIEELSSSFQVVVMATRGLSHTADIAIDDFLFFQCTNDTDLEQMYFESTTSVEIENNTSVSQDGKATMSRNGPDIIVLDKEVNGDEYNTTEIANSVLLRKLGSHVSEIGEAIENGHYTDTDSTIITTNTPVDTTPRPGDSISPASREATNYTYQSNHFESEKRLSEILSSRKTKQVLTENVAVFPVEVINENMVHERTNTSSVTESTQTTISEKSNKPQGLKFWALLNKPMYLAAIAGACLVIALSVVIITVLIFKRRKIWGRKKSDDQLTVLYTKKSETYSSI